jgi:uncharacterized OB-fold protein
MSGTVETMADEVNLSYDWNYTPELRAFYEGLRDEAAIKGSRCPDCGHVMVVPEIMCSLCYTEVEDDLVDVGDEGVLNAWTEVHIPFPMQPREPPYIWAFVDLDGADTSLIHVLGEVSADEVGIGDRVRANWRPESKREGTLADIRYFEPAD